MQVSAKGFGFIICYRHYFYHTWGFSTNAIYVMQSNSFLLYGANGYTGTLIAKYAADYGLNAILAGRNRDAIKSLAGRLNMSYKIFELTDSAQLLAALREVKVVLHAAGPFVDTSRLMIDACLQTGTHYLDINGDTGVFESIKQMDALAKEKNILLLPGVGFDVVPTDCMALHLKNKLPDATHLKLAFASLGGGISHGTAMTVVNKLGEGGAARENNKIVKKPLGEKGMWIEFGAAKLFVMSIPWGDVSTAHFTTGIPNIESYTAIKPIAYKLLKVQKLFNWLLRLEWVRNIIRKKVKTRPAGPDDEMRSKAKSLIWGEARNENDKVVSSRFSCADGYTLTALGSLIIAKKVLEGNFKTGYQTPASCYGENLISEIPGTDNSGW